MKTAARLQKALKEVATLFDIEATLPIESSSDILREAASVIAYFDMKDKFVEQTCRNCNMRFAYAYYTSAVKCCSVPCMAAHLATLGLAWDPTAPLERRWGPRGVPAIVPAAAYQIIQEQAPPPIIEEKPALSNEAQDLVKMLDQL